MIRDAADMADDANVQADVCIVGAGAAGITIALGLIDSGMDVVLLEGGGLEREDSSHMLYEGTMSGIDTFDLDSHRVRYFGGSTNRWGGWCMPLNAEDFEARDYIPMSGWPITSADLEPYYVRAHERVELGPFAWDAGEIAALEGLPILSHGALTTRFFRYSPPTRFGRHYRTAIENAANVNAYLHANLVNVAVDGSRVSHLDCRVLDGPRFRVAAVRYVLAMGGLENARMLLASGIANESGLVGRCFMEHPHLINSAGWLTVGPVSTEFYELRPTPDGPDEMRGAIALTREVREAEGLPDLTATLSTEPIADADTGEVLASDMNAMWKRGEEDTRFYRLSLRAEQTPWTESYLSLKDDRDALGVPRIDLRWQVRDEDLRAYTRSMELIGRELGAAGLGRIYTPHDSNGRFVDSIFPGGHHMGTTRMSESPAMGVVDRDCRCHDVENLYVAGSSVFTTGGSANPTLTIVALAERLADHLRGGEA